jgi:hypothetical protein
MVGNEFDSDRLERSRHADERRFRYRIDTIHGDNVKPHDRRQVERGAFAVIRGTVRDERRSTFPSEIVCVVNGGAAYRVLLERAEADGSFALLACVPTATLPLGPNSFCFHTRSETGNAQEQSGVETFDVTPICVREPSVPYDIRKTAGAVDDIHRDANSIHIRGWILDSIDHCAPHFVYVEFPESRRYAMEAGAYRGDVARELALPYALFSGFTGSISLEGFEPGTHTGRVYALSIFRTALFTCDATVTFTVEP